jgi:hypothetical protein
MARQTVLLVVTREHYNMTNIRIQIRKPKTVSERRQGKMGVNDNEIMTLERLDPGYGQSIIPMNANMFST